MRGSPSRAVRHRPCCRRSRSAWTSRRCASRRAGGRECGHPSSRSPSAPSPFLDQPLLIRAALLCLPHIRLRARLILERERLLRHLILVALDVLVDVDLVIALERLGVEWRDRLSELDSLVKHIFLVRDGSRYPAVDGLGELQTLRLVGELQEVRSKDERCCWRQSCWRPSAR